MKNKRLAAKSAPPKEANQYDKVIKEALRQALPVLMTDILKFPPGDFRPIHVELQRTIEKKADFLGKLFASGSSRTIAHLEVQVKDERRMVFREHLYLALLLSAYPDWDVEQVVFFIGKKKPTMPTTLIKKRLDFHFRLIWIKDIAYQDFLKTGKPEIMLFAALAGYGDRNVQEVMTEVVNEGRKAAKSDSEFKHFTEQLHILSNIHNLQQIFEEVMLNISEYIDERKDPFFQRGEKIGIEKGIKKGIKKGIEKGFLQGLTEKTLEIVTNLILQSDHDDAFIARIAGVEEPIVAHVRDLIRQHPDDFKDRLKEIDLK